MNPGVTEEVGKQLGSFMEIMRAQPLSLALVMMNILLIAYLFYSQSQTLTQRKEALDQIVAWQRGTDQLMASCVSSDVMRMVIQSLERDRELYRSMLPSYRLLPDGPKLQSEDGKPAELPPGSQTEPWH